MHVIISGAKWLPNNSAPTQNKAPVNISLPISAR